MLRILIIDDVETNRFVLRNIITDMGHQPVLAENGKQGLKIMEHMMPALILLDVAMPEMDGFEFAEIIKKDVKTRNIPIIFISAFDAPQDIVKGFEAGGADYVTKPFIQEVVKSRVDVQLKLAEMNKTLADTNRRLQISVAEQTRTYTLSRDRGSGYMISVWFLSSIKLLHIHRAVFHADLAQFVIIQVHEFILFIRSLGTRDVKAQQQIVIGKQNGFPDDAQLGMIILILALVDVLLFLLVRGENALIHPEAENTIFILFQELEETVVGGSFIHLLIYRFHNTTLFSLPTLPVCR